MKKTFVLLACASLPLMSFAQTDSINNAQNPNREVTVTNVDKNVTEYKTVDEGGDTTRIRIGNKGIEIIEKNGKTSIDTKDLKDQIQKGKEEEELNNKYGDFEKNDDSSNGIDEMIQDKMDEKFGKKHHNHFEPHWAGFGMGFNSYATSSGSTSMTGANSYLSLVPQKSYDVVLNIWELGLPVSQNLGFVTGVGFNWNHYRFDGNNNIQKDANGIIISKPAPEGISYDVSRLRTTYLNIPLMIEYQGNISNHKAYASVGGQVGFLLGQKTTIEYNDTENKSHSSKNLTPITYGLTARIGYRFLNLYANYNLSPLFEKNKGPEVYPFSVGLMFVNF
jgi:hypothetical protein